MPVGLVIVKWDEVIGPVIVGKHPENLFVEEDDILRLFTSHSIGDERERYLSLSLEGKNFSTYYMKWEDTPYLGVLILSSKENPGAFKDIVPTYFSKMVEEIGEGRPIIEALETTYDEILYSISYTNEQRIFLVFFEPVGVQIFKLLTEEPSTREGILRKLEERFGQAASILNFDHYILALKAGGIVKEVRVAGMTEPLFFLVKDVVLHRSLPIKPIKRSGELPKEVKDEYADSVKRFFEGYEVDDEDNAFFAVALLDNKVYDVFRILREECYSFEELIEALQVGVEELEEILSTLEELEAVIRLSFGGKTYVLLKTDFRARTFKPEYMVNKITEAFIEGRIEREIAIEHLEFLKKELT